MNTVNERSRISPQQSATLFAEMHQVADQADGKAPVTSGTWGRKKGTSLRFSPKSAPRVDEVHNFMTKHEVRTGQWDT